MGIEPTLSAWEAEVLPLNYTRIEVEGDSGKASALGRAGEPSLGRVANVNTGTMGAQSESVGVNEFDNVPTVFWHVVTIGECLVVGRMRFVPLEPSCVYVKRTLPTITVVYGHD